MTAKILDGRKTREALLPNLVKKIDSLPKAPTIAIIQVGDRSDSTAFVGAKKAFARKVKINERHIKTNEDVSQTELVDIVQKCNAASDIRGIVVQLPLPIHIDRDAILDVIDPMKDVDGLTAKNVKRWLAGKDGAIYPATARGIRELLNHYDIGLSGEKVTIIGRSMLVGKPIAAMCLNANATINVCHSQSPDLTAETKSADIIISAVGKPRLIGKEHVKSNQIIIDVGITRTSEGNLVGDVDFEAVSDIVTAVTPVPGGVGPMTVLALFENLVDLCYNGSD